MEEHIYLLFWKKNSTIMHKYFMHIHILNSSYQASVAYYYYYSIFFRRIGNILYKIIKYNCSLYFRKKCNSPDLETYFLFNQKKSHPLLETSWTWFLLWTSVSQEEMIVFFTGFSYLLCNILFNVIFCYWLLCTQTPCCNDNLNK